MKNIYLISILLGSTIIIGCGSSSSSTDSPQSSNPTTSRTLASIHKYKITAIPTSTQECKGANGDMVIKDSSISGTIKTDWGDILTISGTYNKSSGDVAGGFAKNSKRLVEYSGIIENNIGTGTWEDSIGCKGTWRGVGDESNYITSQQNSENIDHSKKVDAHNIEGYKIGFDYERGTTASINFGCDGSFSFDLTLSGVVRNSMRGDDITISNSKMKLIANSSEEISISLDKDDYIIKNYSKVTELDSYTVNSINQVSNCN